MSKEIDWQAASLTDLTNHIINVHHALLYRKLPLISALLNESFRELWMKHPSMVKAHQLYHEMQANLLQHLMVEETAGFPLIQASEKDKTVSLDRFTSTLGDHEKAHANVLTALAEIRGLLWDFSPPAEFGATIAHCVKELDAIEKDLKTHIHLENDILFKRVA